MNKAGWWHKPIVTASTKWNTTKYKGITSKPQLGHTKGTRKHPFYAFQYISGPQQQNLGASGWIAIIYHIEVRSHWKFGTVPHVKGTVPHVKAIIYGDVCPSGWIAIIYHIEVRSHWKFGTVPHVKAIIYGDVCQSGCGENWLILGARFQKLV